MTGLRSIPGVILLVVLSIAPSSTQTLQEGVDLVTTKSNDIIPSLLGSLTAKNENFVVGPFGIFSSVAMALEASRGKTREEILNALSITEEQIPTLRVGFKAYCDLFLEHASNSEAAGAFNTLQATAGYPLRTEFVETLANFYCANVTTFAAGHSPSAVSLESHVGVMSHWKNYEKLAVYTFLSQQALRPFTKKNGLSMLVPMVPLVGLFRTGLWERARVVVLPLETSMVELVIIVPNNPKQINTLAKSITSKALVRIFENLSHEELEIFIPQLTIVNKKMNLAPLLKNMGIYSAFELDYADLTKATERQNVHLQNVTQDAYFSTSFVAVNSVAGISTNLKNTNRRRRKRDSAKLYFNQPYLFLILHRDTNLVLIAGKVESPIQVPT